MEQAYLALWAILFAAMIISVVTTLKTVADGRRELSVIEHAEQSSDLEAAEKLSVVQFVVTLLTFGAALYTSAFAAQLILMGVATVTIGVATYFAAACIFPSMQLLAEKRHSTS
jgi:hypothetical protein